jgi:Transposase domain (DUF772)
MSHRQKSAILDNNRVPSDTALRLDELKLVEELRMHLAWRWFTGLGFDQEIPHHSNQGKSFYATTFFNTHAWLRQQP